jgi:AraC-like DNA-binding protein
MGSPRATQGSRRGNPTPESGCPDTDGLNAKLESAFKCNTAPAPEGNDSRAMEKGTIAIYFVEAALDAVRARGLDAERLLVQVGIAPSLLNAPQARVSPAHYAALWRLIAETLGDELFGLDSRRVKVGSFAMLCRAVIQCETLERALHRCSRFYDLLLDDVSIVVSRDGKDARLTLHERIDRRGCSQRVFAHEGLLIILHGLACWLVGRRIPITVAEFGYPEPAHSAEYHTRFSSELAFCRPNTAITFDACYLDLPVVQDGQSVKEFLRVIPENILVKYKNTNSLTAKIRARLRRALPDELPGLEIVARELHTTPATLRRRLQDEGESFQSIKDQLRRDLAIMYLSHSERSVLDIALELGFAEPSAFHRAFKKWTGACPGEHRRGLGHSAPAPEAVT